MLRTLDAVVIARIDLLDPVEIACENLSNDVVDQRALARTGNACNTDESAQRNLNRDVLQVVVSCADDAKPRDVAVVGVGDSVEWAHAHRSRFRCRSASFPGFLSFGHVWLMSPTSFARRTPSQFFFRDPAATLVFFRVIARRFLGISISSSPRRYRPVTDRLVRMIRLMSP